MSSDHNNLITAQATDSSLGDGALPQVQRNTVHALIIDAGSEGSRMHVYEYFGRILESTSDVILAAAGKKLTYPSTNSQWTERLSPGLNSLASVENDDDLIAGVVEYLTPLLDFAKQMLFEKQNMFSHFPIYLHATAGMRELIPEDRMRIMTAVHSVLDDPDFNPFAFTHEYARVISGEEEAVFGWTAINFLLQTLLDNTAGQGTVVNPTLTYGALDMGGASTQISFYDSRQDVMSNLFKLQIGASKHWNVYAHSYLTFGVVSAYRRLNAKLYSTSNASQSDATTNFNNSTVYNPCLPGKSLYNFTSNIEIGPDGIENKGSTFYTVQIANPNDGGDFNQCAKIALQLLEKAGDKFCNFSHSGDCSFAGVYQPRLPTENSNNFGEFFAFGHFYHLWESLRLEPRSNLNQLREKAIILCGMSLDELTLYNENYGLNISVNDLPEICFRSAFTFQILHKGYGFALDSNVTASRDINGQQVSWALGSILYEINTRPWIYLENNTLTVATPKTQNWTAIFIVGFLFYLLAIPFCFYVRRRRTSSYVKLDSLRGDELESFGPNVNKGYES